MLVLTVELWWIHWRNCRISRSIKVGLLFLVIRFAPRTLWRYASSSGKHLCIFPII